DDDLRRFQLGALARDEAARVEAWLGTCAGAITTLREVRAADPLTAAIPAALRLDLPAHPAEGEVIRVATLVGGPGGPLATASVTGPALPPAVGGFPVVRELGRGGMGVVYEAADEKLRRPVAVKVMAGAMAARPEARERFLREARAA